MIGSILSLFFGSPDERANGRSPLVDCVITMNNKFMKETGVGNVIYGYIGSDQYVDKGDDSIGKQFKPDRNEFKNIQPTEVGTLSALLNFNYNYTLNYYKQTLSIAYKQLYYTKRVYESNLGIYAMMFAKLTKEIELMNQQWEINEYLLESTVKPYNKMTMGAPLMDILGSKMLGQGLGIEMFKNFNSKKIYDRAKQMNPFGIAGNNEITMAALFGKSMPVMFQYNKDGTHRDGLLYGFDKRLSDVDLSGLVEYAVIGGKDFKTRLKKLTKGLDRNNLSQSDLNKLQDSVRKAIKENLKSNGNWFINKKSIYAKDPKTGKDYITEDQVNSIVDNVIIFKSNKRIDAQIEHMLEQVKSDLNKKIYQNLGKENLYEKAKEYEKRMNRMSTADRRLIEDLSSEDRSFFLNLSPSDMARVRNLDEDEFKEFLTKDEFTRLSELRRMRGSASVKDDDDNDISAEDYITASVINTHIINAETLNVTNFIKGKKKDKTYKFTDMDDDGNEHEYNVTFDINERLPDGTYRYISSVAPGGGLTITDRTTNHSFSPFMVSNSNTPGYNGGLATPNPTDVFRADSELQFNTDGRFGVNSMNELTEKEKEKLNNIRNNEGKSLITKDTLMELYKLYLMDDPNMSFIKYINRLKGKNIIPPQVFNDPNFIRIVNDLSRRTDAIDKEDEKDEGKEGESLAQHDTRKWSVSGILKKGLGVGAFLTIAYFLPEITNIFRNTIAPLMTNIWDGFRWVSNNVLEPSGDILAYIGNSVRHIAEKIGVIPSLLAAGGAGLAAFLLGGKVVGKFGVLGKLAGKASVGLTKKVWNLTGKIGKFFPFGRLGIAASGAMLYGASNAMGSTHQGGNRNYRPELKVSMSEAEWNEKYADGDTSLNNTAINVGKGAANLAGLGGSVSAITAGLKNLGRTDLPVPGETANRKLDHYNRKLQQNSADITRKVNEILRQQGIPAGSNERSLWTKIKIGAVQAYEAIQRSKIWVKIGWWKFIKIIGAGSVRILRAVIPVVGVGFLLWDFVKFIKNYYKYGFLVAVVGFFIGEDLAKDLFDVKEDIEAEMALSEAEKNGGVIPLQKNVKSIDELKPFKIDNNVDVFIDKDGKAVVADAFGYDPVTGLKKNNAGSMYFDPVHGWVTDTSFASNAKEEQKKQISTISSTKSKLNNIDHLINKEDLKFKEEFKGYNSDTQIAKLKELAKEYLTTNNSNRQSLLDALMTAVKIYANISFKSKTRQERERDFLKALGEDRGMNGLNVIFNGDGKNGDFRQNYDLLSTVLGGSNTLDTNYSKTESNMDLSTMDNSSVNSAIVKTTEEDFTSGVVPSSGTLQGPNNTTINSSAPNSTTNETNSSGNLTSATIQQVNANVPGLNNVSNNINATNSELAKQTELAKQDLTNTSKMLEEIRALKNETIKVYHSIMNQTVNNTNGLNIQESNNTAPVRPYGEPVNRTEFGQSPYSTNKTNRPYGN